MNRSAETEIAASDCVRIQYELSHSFLWDVDLISCHYLYVYLDFSSDRLTPLGREIPSKNSTSLI